MSTVDFLDESIPLPKEINDKYDILDLEQAFHVDGRQLWYGQEKVKMENIVIVYDDQARGWVRGKHRMKYRVMKTGTERILGPFPAGAVMKRV